MRLLLLSVAQVAAVLCLCCVTQVTDLKTGMGVNE